MKDMCGMYIRMNADPEKDYNFTYPVSKPVSSLYEIFSLIPVVLSPSYFYLPEPEGFAVSVHPGYLTAEGSMLFTDEADDSKYLKRIPDDAAIGDAIVDGQLVVPLWKFDPTRYYTVIAMLLFWLYLDLPAHLSPTPGTAPTTILAKIAATLLPEFKEVAEAIEGEGFNTDAWRYGFFAIHIIKCLLIFFLFRVGLINPRAFAPWNRNKGPSVDGLTTEVLKRIGWTGCRRMPPFDWVSKHRDHIIAKAGSVVKAHMLGLLDLKDGLTLKPGEGWSVLAEPNAKELMKVDHKFLNSQGKFVISERYLTCISQYAYELWTQAEGDEVQLDKLTKDVLVFGFLDGPPALKELYTTLCEEQFPGSTQKSRQEAVTKQ